MSPHALKGQKLPAQGSALGIKYNNKHTPCKGKSFKILSDNKAFALTGRLADCYYTPGRCPGLGASALSGRMELTYESSVI